MAQYRSVRDLDWPLLVIALCICAIGVLQIYSATLDTGWNDAWWKQVIWICAGLVVMWLSTQIDYHTLLGQVPVLYVLSLLALVATLFIGRSAGGARRWIPLAGGIHLQASEFMKLVIVLLIARYLSELKGERLEALDLLKLAGLVAVPMALVVKQPDLGTALTYLPILGVGLFLAGLRWQHLMVIVIVGALVLPVGWYLLKDYQKARIRAFADPRFIRGNVNDDNYDPDPYENETNSNPNAMGNIPGNNNNPNNNPTAPNTDS